MKNLEYFELLDEVLCFHIQTRVWKLITIYSVSICLSEEEGWSLSWQKLGLTWCTKFTFCVFLFLSLCKQNVRLFMPFLQSKGSKIKKKEKMLPYRVRFTFFSNHMESMGSSAPNYVLLGLISMTVTVCCCFGLFWPDSCRKLAQALWHDGGNSFTREPWLVGFFYLSFGPMTNNFRMILS